MRVVMRQALRALVGFASGLVAACGPGGEPEAAPEEAVAPAMDGLSREEIQRHAEAISPEVAESLGIVDTTIFLENPTLSGTPFPLDSLSAALTDTTR